MNREESWAKDRAASRFKPGPHIHHEFLPHLCNIGADIRGEVR